MKKNVAGIFIFCLFPLVAYAGQNNGMLDSYSTGDIIGTLFQWMLLIAVPLFVLFAIFLGIKNFFKKSDAGKEVRPSNITDIILKLIIPYCIFAAMFVFSKYKVMYACDCFAGDYGKITANITAILFLVILIGAAYFMRKNKKEWKIFHTLLLIVSFLITFYSVMAIGQYFYAL